jgi:hypothetical protein
MTSKWIVTTEPAPASGRVMRYEFDNLTSAQRCAARLWRNAWEGITVTRAPLIPQSVISGE